MATSSEKKHCKYFFILHWTPYLDFYQKVVIWVSKKLALYFQSLPPGHIQHHGTSVTDGCICIYFGVARTDVNPDQVMKTRLYQHQNKSETLKNTEAGQEQMNTNTRPVLQVLYSPSSEPFIDANIQNEHSLVLRDCKNARRYIKNKNKHTLLAKHNQEGMSPVKP